MVQVQPKAPLQQRGKMSENKDFEKLVIHISRERAEKLNSMADQLKLSRGSIIRQALDEFLESKTTDKKTKK